MARTRLRIGITSARELELEVDGEAADDVIKDIEKARPTGELVWIVDHKGHRHGIYADRVAFIEIQSDDDAGGIGFTAG